MILYPFQPGRTGGYSIVGFDEQTRQPRGELLLLPAGESPPAEFRGGAIFGGSASGDPRQLLPAALAPPDARGIWADTQISGGELEAYLRALIAVWGARLWVWVDPICMRFPVPCPTGVGETVFAADLQDICTRYPSHFSPELLCRYCFFSSDGQPAVVLFDTEDTCREKLALLRRLGVQQVFGFLPQE